ncbi:MAG TPA: flavin reductase family protein [Micromonospora sp.]
MTTYQAAAALRSQTLLREVLSRWASGVTVITTVDLTGRPWGFTATSFAPVSLDPPLVAFCLSNSAQCRPVFGAAPGFAVHILRLGQEEIARTFATRGADKFAAVATAPGAYGVPVLGDSLACLECRTTGITDAGDHVVVFGEVHRAEAGDGEPLLYFRRGFGRLLPLAQR